MPHCQKQWVHPLSKKVSHFGNIVYFLHFHRRFAFLHFHRRFERLKTVFERRFHRVLSLIPVAWPSRRGAFYYEDHKKSGLFRGFPKKLKTRREPLVSKWNATSEILAKSNCRACDNVGVALRCIGVALRCVALVLRFLALSFCCRCISFGFQRLSSCFKVLSETSK